MSHPLRTLNRRRRAAQALKPRRKRSGFSVPDLHEFIAKVLPTMGIELLPHQSFFMEMLARRRHEDVRGVKLGAFRYGVRH